MPRRSSGDISGEGWIVAPFSLGILPGVIFGGVEEAVLVQGSAVPGNYSSQNAACFDSSRQTPATVLGHLFLLRLAFLCFLF